MTIPRTEQTKLARTDEHVSWRTAKCSVDEKSGEIYLLLEVQRVWDLRSVGSLDKDSAREPPRVQTCTTGGRDRDLGAQ